MSKAVEHYLCGKFISEGNWSHMRRSMPVHEIILMLEGEMYIAEDEEKYVVRAHDLLFLKAGRTHYGYRVSDAPVSFYWMHYGAAPGVFSAFPPHSSIQVPSMANQLFKQLLHVCSFSSEEADAAALLLLRELERNLQTDYRPHNAIVDHICKWVDIHLHTNMTVSEIAEHFNFNKDYISKMVKREKGIGLKAYILTERMRRAKWLLLNTNASVKEIAAQCGFNDYKLFLRTFKQHEGNTPTEYRNHLYSTQLNRL
ncbi:AraC family transcriptional regulator [Paenibacillus barcinonensis]|uniref:AraC family transcriptional regulator n=1 Tax=Paenibacillus barcinonensis TaxID=198119 RepID=A0A2V4VM62_PAEBA|nr:helix-turn-helix domain-containing protein [Paenibacillus barcinonensis]PYE47251.1 AraC family transcriptional regulator [Paenibacillus barcinonensis]QKS58592.1 AraC family transcriptional regulator [Paenibacillus barcinonensis]